MDRPLSSLRTPMARQRAAVLRLRLGVALFEDAMIHLHNIPPRPWQVVAFAALVAWLCFANWDRCTRVRHDCERSGGTFSYTDWAGDSVCIHHRAN